MLLVIKANQMCCIEYVLMINWKLRVKKSLTNRADIECTRGVLRFLAAFAQKNSGNRTFKD